MILPAYRSLREPLSLIHIYEDAWLLNISNNVTKQAIKDACTAYKNFFRGLQKFPRFKSKKRSMPCLLYTSLTDGTYEQMSLFEDTENNERHRKLDAAMDEIRMKFGNDKITSASIIDVYKRQDVNSAFLSWESARRVSQRLPDLREIPSCVGGNPKKRTEYTRCSRTKYRRKCGHFLSVTCYFWEKQMCIRDRK